MRKSIEVDYMLHRSRNIDLINNAFFDHNFLILNASYMISLDKDVFGNDIIKDEKDIEIFSNPLLCTLTSLFTYDLWILSTRKNDTLLISGEIVDISNEECMTCLNDILKFLNDIVACITLTREVFRAGSEYSRVIIKSDKIETDIMTINSFGIKANANKVDIYFDNYKYIEFDDQNENVISELTILSNVFLDFIHFLNEFVDSHKRKQTESGRNTNE